jgi:ADP-dependent NAD(P)H-hydrate dehydratase / NAD(P)H-hydrate epimerase
VNQCHHPVLSCKESIAFEQEYFKGDPALAAEAMEKAGRALGQAIGEASAKRLFLNPGILLILGKGHNAGDALIACDELLKLNPAFGVDIIPVFGTDSWAPAVLPWFQRIAKLPNSRVLREYHVSAELRANYGLSIDGVFGMQFRPPLSESVTALFELLNQYAIDVRVAVDLPSGISDEGALRADYTYATGICKTPLCLPEFQALCGRVRYLDLGFFDHGMDRESNTRILSPEVLKRASTMRPICSDKRSFGHLLIVAGSRTMPGALLMAVKSALRSGVGLVTVITPESLSVVYSAHAPEAMWIPWAETPDGGLALEGLYDLQRLKGKVTAILMGPGVGTDKESQALLDGVCELFDVPFIVDADALQPERIQLLSRLGKSMILTPHAGEYRRIAGLREEDEIMPSIVDTFIAETGAIVVLKGPLTRIASEGKHYLSPYGGPVLARGGSGDILAGMIAGKVANPLISSSLESVFSGVVVHGKAADRLSSSKDENHTHTTAIFEYLSLF